MKIHNIASVFSLLCMLACATADAKEYTEAQKAMQYRLIAENVISSPEELDSRFSYYISYNRDWYIIKRLLEAGADPSGCTVEANKAAMGKRVKTGTPYLLVCINNHTDTRIMDMLIDAGADVTPNFSNNLTYLHIVCLSFEEFRSANPGRWEGFLSRLIERGVNVNQQEASGCTALMVAAESGDVDLVRFLLSKGADPNLRHKNGLRAIDFVRTSNMNAAEIRKLLGEASSSTITPTAE